MKAINAWCKKHDKLYIIFVYGVGLAIGFGAGFQVGLWKQGLQSIAVQVYSLLGAI